MPKRKVVKDESGAGDAKKAKITPIIDGLTVQFEWEGDGGKWQQFSKEHSEEICDAYNSNKKDITLNAPGGVQLIINFEKMTQKNKKTSWQRRIRSCFLESGDYHAWEWKDEGKGWAPYSIPSALQLEKAFNAGTKNLKIKIANQDYEMDLSNMTQKNDKSGYSREIQREKSVAPPPSPSKPVASTSTSAPAKRTSARAKAPVKKEPEDDDDDDDEEEDVKPAAKSKGKGKAKSAASGRKGTAAADDENGSVKTIIIKGKAPVDPECHAKKGNAHVYVEGKDVYDAMLNQTNLQFNNNKYYICQLLEDDAAQRYNVWFRWGRVGKTGQNSLIPCGGDVEKAKKEFRKKFQDKTKNDWSARHSFVKVPGKYDLLAMDYNTEDKKAESSDEDKKDTNKKRIDSKLAKELQSLIELICDVKAMEDAVVEMKYDSKKAPLGKLTTDQIKAGYAALKEIDDIISKKGAVKTNALVQACNDFYTRIPHDFGMRVPPLIRTEEEVKAKIELLDALSDIQIAMKMLSDDKKSDKNPVDQHYESLACDLKPLDSTSSDFKMVEDYLQKTHASTHSHYKMKVLDVFEVEKHGEKNKFKDVGNRKLLWHGSRLTNWVGILKQGLRIAPPEAPVTGYMFGKGVYFADVSSKSANYCFASRAKNVGLCLLSEVALGNTNDLLNADYNAHKLPAGKHSVKGLGSVGPDPASDFVLPNNCVVPMGKPKNTGVNNPHGYTLNYNEYIVYDTKQIKMKYLVKIKFQF